MRPCTRCARWIRRHLGRRGAALLFFAFLDGVVAWSLAQPETAALAKATPNYAVLIHVSLTIWTAVWALVAAACFVQAWQRRDQFAFGLVIALKLIWGCAILAAIVITNTPRSIPGAAIYLSLAAFVAVIAGWPEPLESPEPPDA